MADHEGNNTENSALDNNQNPDPASTAVLSTNDPDPASTAAPSTNNPSSSSGGRNWTPDEIWLLLAFIEANCGSQLCFYHCEGHQPKEICYLELPETSLTAECGGR